MHAICSQSTYETRHTISPTTKLNSQSFLPTKHRTSCGAIDQCVYRWHDTLSLNQTTCNTFNNQLRVVHIWLICTEQVNVFRSHTVFSTLQYHSSHIALFHITVQLMHLSNSDSKINDKAPAMHTHKIISMPVSCQQLNRVINTNKQTSLQSDGDRRQHNPPRFPPPVRKQWSDLFYGFTATVNFISQVIWLKNIDCLIRKRVWSSWWSLLRRWFWGFDMSGLEVIFHFSQIKYDLPDKRSYAETHWLML